jgi:putative component of toxin-antitoxin plasmid stabilization module
MQPEWLVTYLDGDAFLKLVSRFHRPMQREISNFIYSKLRIHGLDSVALGFSKALGQGLYELKVSFRPEVELRVFFTARPGREIVVLLGYDKKLNDSKNWQNGQILLARTLLESLDEK